MQDEATTTFRLSPQQELLLAAEDAGPGSSQGVVLLEGPLDVERLRSALNRVVERHEILRTTFERRPGMRLPLQVVAPATEPAWDTNVLQALAPDEQERKVPELLAEALREPWDLERGPLVRARLLSLAPDRHVLGLTVSAVCAEPASIATVVRELAQHYGGGEVVDEPLQYADFAEWQLKLLAGDDDEARAGKQFWEEHAGGPATAVPFVHASGAVRPADAVDVALGDAAGRLDEALVNAGWHVLLGRLGGDGEVAVATLSGERQHAELETAVGAFMRPVPLRSRLSGDPTAAEVANQLRHAGELAARWQDYAPQTAAAGLSAAFGSTELPERLHAGELSFEVQSLTGSGADVPVLLEWSSRRGGGGEARLRFDPRALERSQAERIARYLGRVLEGISARPDVPIDDLELLDPEDVRRLTIDVNETSREVQGRLVHELFAASAARAGERPAVVDELSSTTYAELDARSTQLAHRLRRLGVGPDVVVGLCTDRSVDTVVGVLGILKAGGAYLPLNFEHPPARLAHQLRETGAPVLVTQAPVLPRLPEFDGEVVCVDRDRPSLDSEPTDPLEPVGSPENLVYVIYTSGSTGTPKGVAVTHANLVSYVEGIGSVLGLGDEPLSFGMVTAISTDLGNTVFFTALCCGGTLVLVSPVVASDVAAMTAFVQAHPIDVLKITPSHLNALLVGPEAAPVLPRRWLVTGGETLTWDLAARVQALGGCRLLNHYGPTETTVGSCAMEVADGPGPYSPSTVPIGRPLPNDRCYVLDGRGRPVPEGVAGYLHVGGAGVARGYIGQPELTAERFVPDPFAGGDARMYATGDLARRLPDGTIEFLGRADDQVKIRGFRIEPAEIESVLRASPAVREAVVLARDDGRRERRLVAYVVADPRTSPDDLRRHAADWLPEVMIPAAFVVLDEMPRTPSGKIDRIALPSPEDVEAGAEHDYVAPRTPIEEAVAAIWADVLGLERVSVEDDFFAVGGHSLLATQIVAQVRSDFSIDLPLHALFTSPTVAALSEQIAELLHGDEDETESLLAELEGLTEEEAELLLAGEDDQRGTA